MKTKLIIILSAALILCSGANLYGAVLVYESFGDAPEANTTLAGYSGTSAEVGLAGTWSVTGGSQNTISRTTHEYVGIADGYAPDTLGGRQHWWEHNNQWNTSRATRSLSSSIDMTVDGTWYMSFSSMSGIKDFAAQMGLNDGTRELMWGQGYNGGTQGITAYYANIGASANTNGNGTFVTGYNNTTKYETGFFVAKFVKSNSDTTDDLAVSIKYYDFKNLDAPTNVIDSGEPAVWTRVVNLTGVSSVFTTLELKLDGASNNYPSIDEIRIGQSMSDVTGVNVQAVAPLNGAEFVAVDTNLEWVVASGWNVNVYLSDAYNEPNTAPVLSQVDTDNASGLYDPASDFDYGKWYYWRLDSLEPNIPNDIVHPGKVWGFKTVGLDPTVNAVTPSLLVVADGAGSAVFSVTGFNVDSYQWYKIGSPDVQLPEDAKYAGVTTNTLTINNVGLADEGYYYCTGSNSLSPNTASNRDTGPGRLMTRRLTSHYPFEVINIVDSNSVTPDTVGGFDAVLMQEGAAGLPVLADANQIDTAHGKYLLLDNADHAADPNGQFAQVPAGVVDYEDITISAWIHPLGGNEWQRVFDFGSGTADYIFLTPDAGGASGMRFAAKVDNGAEQQLNADWLPSGAWYFVTVTMTGNTGRLYRNGELVNTNTSMTINPFDIGAVLNYIGKSQYTADQEFNGMVDDLKIYNYARTTQEIAQDYLAVMGGWVCNNEGTEDLTYDFDGNCQVDLGDFAALAADWLNSNRIYPD